MLQSDTELPLETDFQMESKCGDLYHEFPTGVCNKFHITSQFALDTDHIIGSVES